MKYRIEVKVTDIDGNEIVLGTFTGDDIDEVSRRANRFANGRRHAITTKTWTNIYPERDN